MTSTSGTAAPRFVPPRRDDSSKPLASIRSISTQPRLVVNHLLFDLAMQEDALVPQRKFRSNSAGVKGSLAFEIQRLIHRAA